VQDLVKKFNKRNDLNVPRGFQGFRKRFLVPVAPPLQLLCFGLTLQFTTDIELHKRAVAAVESGEIGIATEDPALVRHAVLVPLLPPLPEPEVKCARWGAEDECVESKHGDGAGARNRVGSGQGKHGDGGGEGKPTVPLYVRPEPVAAQALPSLEALSSLLSAAKSSSMGKTLLAVAPAQSVPAGGGRGGQLHSSAPQRSRTEQAMRAAPDSLRSEQQAALVHSDSELFAQLYGMPQACVGQHSGSWGVASWGKAGRAELGAGQQGLGVHGPGQPWGQQGQARPGLGVLLSNAAAHGTGGPVDGGQPSAHVSSSCFSPRGTPAYVASAHPVARGSLHGGHAGAQVGGLPPVGTVGARVTGPADPPVPHGPQPAHLSVHQQLPPQAQNHWQGQEEQQHRQGPDAPSFQGVGSYKGDTPNVSPYGGPRGRQEGAWGAAALAHQQDNGGRSDTHEAGSGPGAAGVSYNTDSGQGAAVPPVRVHAHTTGLAGQYDGQAHQPQWHGHATGYAGAAAGEHSYGGAQHHGIGDAHDVLDPCNRSRPTYGGGSTMYGPHPGYAADPCASGVMPGLPHSSSTATPYLLAPGGPEQPPYTGNSTGVQGSSHHHDHQHGSSGVYDTAQAHQQAAQHAPQHDGYDSQHGGYYGGTPLQPDAHCGAGYGGLPPAPAPCATSHWQAGASTQTWAPAHSRVAYGSGAYAPHGEHAQLAQGVVAREGQYEAAYGGGGIARMSDGGPPPGYGVVTADSVADQEQAAPVHWGQAAVEGCQAVAAEAQQPPLPAEPPPV
jgi:hypothetical protein